jgi:predicted nuclease of predicted toxin-antitoxin system
VKLLLDTCTWGGARQAIEAAGHDVIYAGDWPEDPGDDEILARAHREKRILITLDNDFGELAVVKKMGHSGIVRLVNVPARQQAEVCIEVLKRYGKELMAGAIVTAQRGSVRIRLPDTE